jgi:hypothetical protein
MQAASRPAAGVDLPPTDSDRLRWHAVGDVLRGDAQEEFALLRVARDNGRDPVALEDGVGAVVEAQLGLSRSLIRTMAAKAGLREDGEDVAIEVDGGGGAHRRQSGSEQ